MYCDEFKEITLSLPKPPSLNQFYAGQHYSVRTKHKSEYWKEIQNTLETFDRFHVERFSLHVRYNCRYDVDNAITCSKFLADYLRNHGYVDDDTPKFFEEQSTRFDSTIPKDRFIVTLKGYGYKIVEPDVLPRNIEDAQRGNKPVRKPTRRGRKPKNGR